MGLGTGDDEIGTGQFWTVALTINVGHLTSRFSFDGR
ncbi:hypothetical protein SAMN05216205_0760 [Pseudomonas mohnii]|uniref:Uncharacterized protein n=1 Tax=Pseudomonas mohnii TaxID=395600 RepID=A0ABY0XPJ7_9PSED|nr:hypothetical protein SAMN05216205_0760 [Pseudomonas mohnii]